MYSSIIDLRKKYNEFRLQEEVLYLKNNAWVPGKSLKKTNISRSYWTIYMYSKR